MNTFVNALRDDANKTYTENGAVTYRSTLNGLMDLFALGGAYRSRSDSDCINLFYNALQEDEIYALKCLFYLRDIRGGQGERRFFRVVCKWLAENHPELIKRNMEYIAEFGRWDDLYAFVDTPLEKNAFDLIKKQLELDVQCKTPSLLAKWLKSENASSRETIYLANKTRQYFKMSHRQYRKTLSILRSRINVLEKLMSANRWEEIEFDKIPSKAGMIYKNAFARRDIIKEKYKSFANDKTTTVNAKTLYPYEIVKQVLDKYHSYSWRNPLSDTDRKMLQKYWENLADYFKGSSFNGICVADTSGSMMGDPMAVAISIAMYCAEKNTGPFANHFFTFSDKPQFLKVDGYDFAQKVINISKAPWGGTTNIEAVFDKMLDIIISNECSPSDVPENVIIISDMEFNACVFPRYSNNTLFENIKEKWDAVGYKMPHLIFWNVNARRDNIPMKPGVYASFVSGFSPIIFEQILKNKTSFDLMFDKLDQERYSCIR